MIRKIEKNNKVFHKIVEDDLDFCERSNSVKSAKSIREESTELNFLKEETSKDDNLKKFIFY